VINAIGNVDGNINGGANIGVGGSASVGASGNAGVGASGNAGGGSKVTVGDVVAAPVHLAAGVADAAVNTVSNVTENIGNALGGLFGW